MRQIPPWEVGHYSPAKYHPGRSCIIRWSKNCQKTGIKIIKLHQYTLPIHVLFAIRWLSASFRWSLRAWLVVWVRVLIWLFCFLVVWYEVGLMVMVEMILCLSGPDIYLFYRPDNCREPLTRCCLSVPMPILYLCSFVPQATPLPSSTPTFFQRLIRYVVCCYDEGYRRCICLRLAMLRLRWVSYK